MKLNKEYNNYLMQIAMKLPLLKDQSCEKHLMKGSEILEWETITELDGKSIDPEKDYLYSFPLVVYVDHLKRLQKAWKRKGPEGVSEYMVWVDNIIDRYKKLNPPVPAAKKGNWFSRALDSITKSFKNAEMDKENIPAQA